MRPDLVEHVIEPSSRPNCGSTTKVGRDLCINPTGRFVIGGPQGDTGLTGRKIVVDTYGGMAPHGGGAFSGKDPTKVDRSAAYAARYVAKNVVAAGASRSVARSDRVRDRRGAPGVDHGRDLRDEQVGPEKLEKLILDIFDLRPAAIIADLDLRRPIYPETAAYGHFGRRDAAFTWERPIAPRRCVRQPASCRPSGVARGMTVTVVGSVAFDSWRRRSAAVTAFSAARRPTSRWPRACSRTCAWWGVVE